MIKEDFPEFFNKISFNIVIDPRYSCNDLHEMFNNSELFSDSNIRSTLIEDFFSYEKLFLMRFTILSKIYMNSKHIYPN